METVYGREGTEHRAANRAGVRHAAMNLRHRRSAPRWWSWPRREPVFAGVLGVVGVALVVVAASHWRRGLVGLGAALLAGALLRLFLPTRRVGLLVARGRVFDVTTLALLGITIIVVTLAVPAGGS
ncbi:DUF3017 domain-containing protein [Frankia sp. Cr2]|uniref:DUF3017 domain-containing protein n=1 Tax=Frankia sp. Cr2 TaxID=3073932 RepID=UPI002AD4ED1F|nr:DUF3017 domain-containing protein [Frankia sp. Cr2]